MRPGAPRAVLDTSCVRGTSRGALQMLKARGFQLHVSGLALSELAVHLKTESAEAGEKQARLRSRMRFLGEFFEGVVPLAPTHGPLLAKLGGRMRGQEDLSFGEWAERAQATWRELIGDPDNPTPGVAFAEGTAQYVAETGADFVAATAAAAALGEPTEEEMALFGALTATLPSIADEMDLPGPLTSAQRFDAYLKVLALVPLRAYGRSVGRRRAAEPNDAIDLNMLQHLADGLILATRDYQLIEVSSVRHWLRTGRLPSVRPARHRLVRREDFERFVSELISAAPRARRSR